MFGVTSSEVTRFDYPLKFSSTLTNHCDNMLTLRYSGSHPRVLHPIYEYVSLRQFRAQYFFKELENIKMLRKTLKYKMEIELRGCP